jgi:acetyltransferase-like isoleucine patch superfamily enzyme
VTNLIDLTLRRLQRDKELPLRALIRKGAANAVGLATAPLWLARADRVGKRCRTVGRPRIVNEGTIEIGDDVTLNSDPLPLELVARGGTLVIGDRVFINYGTNVCATGRVHIGARALVGPFVMIVDTSFHDLHDRATVPPPRPVHLEDDVFVGARAVILPGVRVGRGAVIGAAAVVHRDVEPFTVVAGNPAVVVKRIDPARFVVRDV